MLESWSQLVLPVALCFHLWPNGGRASPGNQPARGMAIIFSSVSAMLYQRRRRKSASRGPLASILSGGNLEGKDLRFGQAGAAMFAAATTGTGTGAANSTFDSLTPLGGLVALLIC